MKPIDQAIQREFDALGFNVVDNENLADLIIARSRQSRLRRTLLILGALFVSGALVFLLSKLVNHDSLGAQIQSTSIISKSSSQDTSTLPLFALVDLDGSKSSQNNASFFFDLKADQLIEFVTHIPDGNQGTVGKLFVYKIKSGEAPTLASTYEIASFTQIQEFGVNQDGKYEFRLVIDKPSFRDRIRVLIARAR
jgi:hypothetical protein